MRKHIQTYEDKMLREGLRINTNLLNRKTFNKEYDIDSIIDDLANLQNLLNVYIENGIYDDLDKEISDVVLELRQWKKDGWKGVKFHGSEWIPLANIYLKH